MKRVFIFIVVLMLALLSTSWLGSESASNAQHRVANVFPSGNWGFSVHPYVGEGYKTRPVVVTSVSSRVSTLAVDGVRVRNISSKPVVGIKFEWVLTYERDRSKSLRRGETPLVPIQSGLEVSSELSLKPTMVSFLEIHKSLVKKGRLDGDYRLEVAVTEVLFSDRSTWRVGEDVSIRPVSQARSEKVSFSRASTLTVTPLEVPDSCPNQKCWYQAPLGPFYCGESDVEEYCTSCFTYCCNSLCGYQPVCDCN